jgi:hypothetical protein
MVGANSSAEPWRDALRHALAADAQTPALVVAIALVSGLVILTLRRNSNVMALDFRPTWPRGAAVAAGLGWSVLQLGKVTPFLYFNF